MSIPTTADSLVETVYQSNKKTLGPILLEILQQSDESTGLLLDTLQALLTREQDQDDTPFTTAFCLAWVDALWFWSLSSSSTDKEESIVTSIRALSESAAGSIARPHLLTSLEASLLEKAGILRHTTLSITTEAEWLKKVRLYNTVAHYKQQKFNLLAEESQGYAKFLSLLSSPETPSATRDARQLMTTFHLDPNRCLDLTLHALALGFGEETNNKRRDALVELLRDAAPTDKLPALLYFQLAAASDDRHKQALLQCMAWLTTVYHEEEPLLSLTHMWSYLWDTTQEDALTSLYNAYYQENLAQVKAMGRVRLSTGGAQEETQSVSKLDLQPLSQSLAVQWLQVLLEQHQASLRLLEDNYILTDEQWSHLLVLFPDTLGVAVCQGVQSQVTAWLPAATTTSQLPTLSQVLDYIIQPLSLILESACIGQVPILYSQICRLLALCLQQEQSEPTMTELGHVLQDFVLPSLSLFPANPAVSHEVWRVLEQLPYRQRYNLYASWRGTGLEKAALKNLSDGSKPLWLVQGELQAGKDARYALKRLSKDTIRDMSRAIAKVCYSHPLVVFTTILNQIESYDNLVQVMVDALRFVTPLSLDVLGFCILSRLSGTTGINRSPLKEDGVTVSQWLQSLESFIGAFYKRFPLVEFQGILCYLLNRLAAGHVMELGVLRTLLKTAGGWAFADYAPAASLSMTQLEGRAGSTLLKRETMSFGVVDKNTNRLAALEIRRVLQQDDLGVSLLILLAQVRHQIVFGSTSGRPKPVKLIGNLFDMCQVTTAILLDFVTNPNEGRTEAIEKYAKSMPSLDDLVHKYKMDVASAWMLCRPLLRAADSMDDEMEEGDVNPLETFKSTMTSQSYESMLPESTWVHMSTDLFEVFFSNTVYDLFCPEDVYAAEISRLDKETDRLTKSLNTPQLPPQPSLAASPANESPAELERVKGVAARLTTDFTTHKSHVESIYTSMQERSGSFFPSDQVSRESMATFLTRCIYPRCMQGPDDAIYCARFIMRLHEMETPGFSTMHFLDCMIVALSRSLFGLTEGEAANVAILLFETWKVLSRWRYEADCFANEVAGKPGALVATTSDSNDGSPITTVHSISSKDFEQLYNKWHAAIGASCLGCLESSEYMHKRCCLIVLTRMVDIFPTRPRLGNKLLQALEPLQDESNTLADIRASAQAYSTQLLKARDEGVWKEEDAATVQARQEKEQAAAAARQKKAVEQMEEMKRESQKITEEIGEWDGRRDRDRRRPEQAPTESRRPTSRAFDAPSVRMDDSRRHDDRRDDRRRAPPPPPPPPPPQRADDRWARDRGPSAPGSGNYSAMASSAPSRGRESSAGGGGTARRGDEGPEHRGLEGRWQRAGEVRSERASGSKRSRPSSPTEQEGERSSKRSRPAGGLEPGEEEPSRGDEGAGGRRQFRRGGRRPR